MAALLAALAAAAAVAAEPPAATSAASGPQAQPAVPAGTADGDVRRTFSIGESWTLLIGPTGDLFPRYIADIRRPLLSLSKANIPDVEIPGAGDSRLMVRVGGRHGFLRFHPDNAPDRGFQIDFEAGFNGIFDSDDSSDNIGWDGTFGLQSAWRPGPRTAVRAGYFHVSSHVGDEYAEDNGRRRIGYTRGEWYLGGSYEFARGFRVYGEGAYGVEIGSPDVMERMRVEGGLEYTSRPFIADFIAWYAATDLSSFEENDWNLNLALQTGFVIPMRAQGRSFRLGFEYYSGRVPVGEFFQTEETHVAFGGWFDF